MLHAILVSLALAANDPPADPPAVERTEIEQLAAVLERGLPRGRALEAQVRMRLWSQKEGEAAPVVEKDPPGIEEYFFVRLWGEDYAAMSQRLQGGLQVYFEGNTYSLNLLERECYTQRGAPTNAYFPLSIVFQVDNFQPLEQPRSLPEILRASRPISLNKAGTVVTYRFTLADEERMLDEQAAKGNPRGKAWPREVVVDLADPPRLVGWSLDMPWKGADHPSVPMGWTVESWQEVEGTLLPRRLARRCDVSRTETPQAYTMLVDVERLAPLNAAERPKHPLPVGYPVESGDLRFVVGSPDVVHKGVALRLKEPLWVAPSDERLAELLGEARPR